MCLTQNLEAAVLQKGTLGLMAPLVSCHGLQDSEAGLLASVLSPHQQLHPGKFSFLLASRDVKMPTGSPDLGSCHRESSQFSSHLKLQVLFQFSWVSTL